MKCLKSIRETKEATLGQIIRVDDKTANNMVGTYWKYVSKTEWKEYRGKIEKVVVSGDTENLQVEDNKRDKKNKKTKKAK